jgi:hypothetical protein
LRRALASRPLARARTVPGARPTGALRAGARRPVRAPSRKRGWTAAAAAVLALALLGWLFWPAAPPLPREPAPVTAAAAAVAASRPVRKAPAQRPPPAAPPAPSGIDEARVRAAVVARSADLRACAVPPGSPTQVPARLRVPASGQVRAVQFGGPEPLPPSLSSCLREKLLLWRFDDLHLASDVELFATFALR